MADDDEDVLSGPICSYLTYKSEGDRLYVLGEYEKAINSYTHALQQEPKNRNCLVARSRCYLAMGNTTLALKDAEASQLGSKEFYKGLYRKAESLYAKGEFELALMFYHRGHKLRPDDRNFRLGIQKAREAIDNSVGSPSSVKLETRGDLSFFYRREEKALPQTKSQLRRQKLNLKQQSMKTDQDEPKTNKTVRVLLGELYGDKEYLENLLLDKELMKTSTESGGTIQELIMNGITFLDSRTEFWRQQKPIFARDREQRIKAQSWKTQRKQAETEQTTFILQRMEEIDMLLADGYPQECKTKAMELVQIVKEWSQREVPNKAEFLGNLYNTIGLAQVELGEFEDALTSHQKDLQIAKKFDNLEAKSRALDNIGRVYARIGEFSKAVEAWTEKEPLTKTHLERTWLFHEIGRCHLELGNNVEARDYGLKALASAQKTGDEEWKMNANVLVAQAELKQSKLQTAVTFFEQALSKAKLLNDEPAQEAISNALKDNKKQIELAEQAKQTELEQLHEKQRAHRLKLGPLVVDRTRTKKQKRAAFSTEEPSSLGAEDVTDSTLGAQGAEKAGGAIEAEESCSEEFSSSDSVCGLYSSGSDRVSDLSPQETKVSPDQLIVSKPSDDFQHSPELMIPAQDGEGTEEGSRTSTGQVIPGTPSNSLVDGNWMEQDDKQVEEEMPEKAESEGVVVSEDDKQVEEEMPEKVESEGVVVSEDDKQVEEEMPVKAESEGGVVSEDANQAEGQLPEKVESEGSFVSEVIDASQVEEQVLEADEGEGGAMTEDANEAKEQLPENVVSEGLLSEVDDKQVEEEVPETIESEGVMSEDANQAEEQLPEKFDSEEVMSEETKTQSGDTENTTRKAELERGETEDGETGKETAEEVEAEKEVSAEEMTEKEETGDDAEIERRETMEEETDKGETGEEDAAPKNE
ncbi:outer dynein arm-docking complex subunit 4 isoform X3 [Stegostoma tigrinum]|uniref:outer dynein arm-docking complex subunit 4 isoform X3 n=1 Tax=Stegostoma tigrinum TaxID=3053191 RepID=UPI00286FC994|nr:outer dynein arm-docking complex subunit 4 isoform X3 [Stegostoma tigrinum]